MKKRLLQRIGLGLVTGLLLLGSGSATAQCSANFTYSLGTGGSVLFTNTSSGTTGTTHYYWDFGDLTYNYNTASPTHTYNANGVYTVQLQIADSSTACFTSITQTLGISNMPCNATTFNFTHTSPMGGVVNFAGNLSGGYTYAWSFGDGATGSGQFPSHTYTTGVYTATVTATGYMSICTYTASQTITVNITPCTLSASYISTTGANGLVNFSSTSTGTSTGSMYYWNFGDGGYSYGNPTSHTYLSNGSFVVLLTVMDSTSGNSCISSSSHTITISNSICSATSSFSLLKDSIQTLNWFAIPNYPLNISAAAWSWGDGSTSAGLYPSHTYSAAGMYNVCLSVTVSCGATFSVCSMSNIFRMSSNNAINQMISIQVVNASGSTVGIKSQLADKNTVAISPNPNDSHFTLSIQGVEKDRSVDIHIVNLLGETIYSETDLSSASTYTKSLDLKNIAAGTYFVKINTDTKIYQSKMIISK